ncbi:DUF7882 family protein [Protaetiibacter mangrovi]|uniref:DUF7882 domain-containing protein n=1 Tax=Protaetiibacter mangrovi TaxID=2970926 RepID=A0ABT1ZDQ8_9MICO|nr:hypothetical protein [Protaetiibacter mangrovi]MCS0498838.1 hypothetical protein [Protaetiibacter mangrovi]
MGTLFYGTQSIEIEDYALAHLKLAVITKLRRGESFTLSWTHLPDDTAGRSTLWFHESIPLRFVFHEPEPPSIDRRWLEEILRSANSTGGIQFSAETVATGEVPALPMR